MRSNLLLQCISQFSNVHYEIRFALFVPSVHTPPNLTHSNRRNFGADTVDGPTQPMATSGTSGHSVSDLDLVLAVP